MISKTSVLLVYEAARTMVLWKSFQLVKGNAGYGHSGLLDIDPQATNASINFEISLKDDYIVYRDLPWS